MSAPRGPERGKEAIPDFDSDVEVQALKGLFERSHELREEVFTKARALHSYIFSLSFKQKLSIEEDDKRRELRDELDVAYRNWQRQYVVALQQLNGVFAKKIDDWRPKLDRIRNSELRFSDPLRELVRNARNASYALLERERTQREGNDARRRADPKERKRMQDLLEKYNEVKRVRSEALADAERVLEDLKTAVALLPPPAPPGPAPASNEFTPEQLKAQDTFNALKNELGHLHMIFLHGKADTEDTLEKDREAGRRSAEYSIGGMPQKWIERDMKARAAESAKVFDSLLTNMRERHHITDELIRDEYLAREQWRTDMEEEKQQGDRFSRLVDESYELFMTNLRRLIRKDDEDSYTLIHRPNEDEP